MQGGYNWQIKRFVFGPEIDFNYNGVNETDIVNRPLTPPVAGNFIHHITHKLDWFGTVRGRAGFTIVPEWLVYVTGGLAYGHIKSETSALFSVGDDHYVGSRSTTRTGWTAGGGSEWAVTPKFSYRDRCVNCDALGFDPSLAYQTEVKTKEHVVRFGLNYRFWGGGR